MADVHLNVKRTLALGLQVLSHDDLLGRERMWSFYRWHCCSRARGNRFL